MLKRAASRLVDLLAFLRVVDFHDRLVSVTNVAVIVCIAKVALTVDPSITELTALMAALLSYS